MAQKPLEPGLKTIVYPYGKRAMTSNIENLKKWGVGAINLNDNYIKHNGKVPHNSKRNYCAKNTDYRFPSNIITDGSAEVVNNFADVRLFNISKAQANDRHQGLGKQEFGKDANKRDDGSDFCFHQELKKQKRNVHTTVKPTDLMRHLVRLIAPPGSTIIDPFSGSGSTGKAIAVENIINNKNYKYIGIDVSDKFNEIAKLRITRGAQLFVDEIVQNRTVQDPDENQLSLMEMFKGETNENI
jgi:DNA modification methylase